MKTAICILFLAALGCNGTATITQISTANATAATLPPAAYNNQTGHPLDGSWQLIPALPSDTATGRIPVLHFTVDSKRITGNTGCNNFSGTFITDGNSLTFNPDMVSTKMACPGYDEAAFEKNLLRTNSYEINGDTLNLKVNQTPLSYWLRAK